MQENKLKICFIIPNLGKGGMERFLSIITREISKVHHVIIITLLNNEEEYNFDNKVQIIHINKKWDNNKIKLFINLFIQLRILKPHLVIGFSEVFNPLSILVSKLNRLKIFISDRSNPLKKHKF